MLSSNLKFLRKHFNFTQSQFAAFFNLTRSNIDSYERGNAKPSHRHVETIAKHYKLPTDALYNKDLKLNPGLLFENSPTEEINYQKLLNAKDELINEQRQMIAFLQQHIKSLVEIRKEKGNKISKKPFTVKRFKQNIKR